MHDLGKTVNASDLRSRHSAPVILTFQPDEFKLAETPEQLRAWEETAVKSFRVPSSIANQLATAAGSNGGSCCESGDTNDCDVD